MISLLRYTDASWTQRLMPVSDFVSQYLSPGSAGADASVGYLAQHNLLDQVPSLREDIVVPDYCYTGENDTQDINVWIGKPSTN